MTPDIWICIGIALVIVAIGFCIIKLCKNSRRLLIFLYVLVLILAARIILNFLLGPELELNALERVFDGIIRTFQSFTLDEDYTEAVLVGEDLLKDTDFALAYGVISSFLNILAPILGGALMLDVLISVFPRLRLAFRFRCSKLVFSELNDASVCLAEDINSKMEDQKAKHKKDHTVEKPGRVMLVFTDVYKNENSESYSELLARAQALGAVCIKTDPSAINLRRSKSVSYVLIDVDPIGNIDGLSMLLNPKEGKKRNWPEIKDTDPDQPAGQEKEKSTAFVPRREFPPIEKPKKKSGNVTGNTGEQKKKDKEEKPHTRVYVFVQSEIETEMIRRILEESGKVKDKILVRSVRDYMNAMINQMYDVPLFLPLLRDSQNTQKDDKDHPKDLTVTILGGGRIAEEAVKAVFWCGQMLDVRLHINVLSRHVEKIRDRIRESCPEMLETCKENSEHLKTFPAPHTTEYNSPYCTEPKFLEIEDATLISRYPKYPDVLSNTDYYIVALGADELNLEVANSLRITLERRSLTRKSPSNVIIAPAVFDSNMAKAANDVSSGKSGICLSPFAANESRFSCRNVFMADFTQSSEKTGKLYMEQKNNAIKKAVKDEYNYWANVARSVHAPYKLFSIGWLKPENDPGSGKLYKVNGEKIENGLKELESIQKLAEVEDLSEAQKKEKKDWISQKQKERDQLAWLEHRRWNAFMRAQGFSCPTPEQYDGYYDPDEAGQHKNIPMKLHPCLVESVVKLDEYPKIGDIDREKAGYDCLDNVTFDDFEREVDAKKINRTREKYKNEGDKDIPGRDDTQEELVDLDYKQYDYPEYDDALKVMLGDEAAALLVWDKKTEFLDPLDPSELFACSDSSS